MRLYILTFTVLAFAAFSSCTGMNRADPPPLPPPGPIRTITVEPGVVPAGTSLVVLTNEAVSTDRAFRATIYDASIAEPVLDQHGNVLIPRLSRVELAVSRLGFLGPGGAGMSVLTLGVRAVTVNGVRYPVETADGTRKGSGFEPLGALAVAGGGAADQLLTIGRRINVPAQTMLIFQIEDPIRLRGYGR